MSEIMDLIMKTVISAAAGALVSASIVWIKSIRNKNRIYDKALKALAHDSFYRQCRYLLAKEYITEDELENLNYLHDAYTSLGMNGTGEELYRRCVEKPIK